ncbi:hypothetical protein BT69DRAFT_539125 [Atractiella rhizophila]|nr:hypothetical protein BT69DRAFT_539125 [Atractiella rhizophila]
MACQRDASHFLSHLCSPSLALPCRPMPPLQPCRSPILSPALRHALHGSISTSACFVTSSSTMKCLMEKEEGNGTVLDQGPQEDVEVSPSLVLLSLCPSSLVSPSTDSNGTYIRATPPQPSLSRSDHY